MADVRAGVAAQDRAGIVPSAGAQRWETTFAASFADGTFRNEPGYIAEERERGGYDHQPEFMASRDFLLRHPQYADMAYDGGTMPNQPDYFRAWKGQWGFISPLTPIDASDCPSDMQAGCVWGDVYAARWARISAITGSYGLMLSDFSDSQPYSDVLHDFNPRIVASFVERYHMDRGLRSLPTPQAATWIESHEFSEWTDFLSAGYAHFFSALARRIGHAAGHPALIIDQCALSPSYGRLVGVDERVIAQTMPTGSYVCVWDDHVVQSDRSGPVANPVMEELAGYVIAAAREPRIRNGANLEADDAAYWTAIRKFYPKLSVRDQRDIGLKLLKRLWTWSAWAHVADRSGHVRRALAFVTRDYGDSGSLAALTPLSSLLQTIVPVHAFGPALYYSVAVERRVEQEQQSRSAGQEGPVYLQGPTLAKAIDGGATFGYYVSDAATSAILAKAGEHPSAWIVLDGLGKMPDTEARLLRAMAPVVTSAEELRRLPDQPFGLSPGLAGFAFRDQNGRLIVVVSNPSSASGASAVRGTVTLHDPQVSYRAVTELFTGERQTVTSVAGRTNFAVTLARWDTKVFAFR